MSLKLGNTDINGLFLGSTAINQAYLGATEVFTMGAGAITVDTTVDIIGDGTAASNITWSHTCSGDDRLLVVTYPESRNVVPTSVTYAGNTMTLAISQTNGNSRAYIYYLINPPTGSNNVVINLSGSITFRNAGSISLNGANQTTPLATTNSQASSGTTRSLATTTTADNSIIIECLASLGGIQTTTAGQTFINGGTGSNRVSAYELAPTIGTYTQTWSSTINSVYSHVLASFNPA